MASVMVSWEMEPRKERALNLDGVNARRETAPLAEGLPVCPTVVDVAVVEACAVLAGV